MDLLHEGHTAVGWLDELMVLYHGPDHASTPSGRQQDLCVTGVVERRTKQLLILSWFWWQWTSANWPAVMPMPADCRTGQQGEAFES